jgi:beta-lactam-binding protein with PASTA domain
MINQKPSDPATPAVEAVAGVYNCGVKSFFRLVLLALALLVVALLSALTAMRLAIHGQEVVIPDLANKSPAEARLIAGQSGLDLSVERQFYSPTVPEGKILSQLPPAGSRVRRGWQVRVAESLGPQRVAIPNVLGQSQRAASINIRRRGLDIDAIARVQMPDAAPDQVLSQDPPPNASGVSTPKLSLLVALPPQSQALVMPSFIGQPLGTVTLALQDAGLRVGTATRMPLEAAPPMPAAPATAVSPASIVASQNPAPGEKVAVGATVNFEVR